MEVAEVRYAVVRKVVALSEFGSAVEARESGGEENRGEAEREGIRDT